MRRTSLFVLVFIMALSAFSLGVGLSYDANPFADDDTETVEGTETEVKECCEKKDGECCKKQECANGGGVADDKKTGKVEANLACPVELNIAKIVELVDKAEAAGKVTPELRKEYEALPHHASECLECGGCERRSKSGVKIVEKMQKAVKLFGK